MLEERVLEMIQRFDVTKLYKIRGGAHEGIIGEWIRWWLDYDPENHLVLNPAPYAQNKTADILFLKKEAEHELFVPFGVAEIENDQKKWLEKLESLTTYGRELPDLKFVLLCVKTGPRSEEAFKRLVEKLEVSLKSPIYWILYRLKAKTWRHDIDLVSLKEDDEVLAYNFIEGGEYLVIKRGNVITF